jgi:hypothetical protein
MSKQPISQPKPLGPKHLSFWQTDPGLTTAAIMAAGNAVAAAVTVPSLMKDRQTAEATKHFLLSDSILGKGIPNIVTLAVAALLLEAVAAALVYISLLPPKNVDTDYVHVDSSLQDLGTPLTDNPQHTAVDGSGVVTPLTTS